MTPRAPKVSLTQQESLTALPGLHLLRGFRLNSILLWVALKAPADLAVLCSTHRQGRYSQMGPLEAPVVFELLPSAAVGSSVRGLFPGPPILHVSEPLGWGSLHTT